MPSEGGTPPLVLTLAAAFYPAIPQTEFEASNERFLSAVRKDFPLQQKITQSSILEIEGAQHQALSQEAPLLLDASQSWSVMVGPDRIVLATKEYPVHDVFLKRMASLVSITTETIKPSHLMRVGYRYVDRIDLTEQDPNPGSFLNPTLFPPELPGMNTRVPYLSLMNYSTANGGDVGVRIFVNSPSQLVPFDLMNIAIALNMTATKTQASIILDTDSRKAFQPLVDWNVSTVMDSLQECRGAGCDVFKKLATEAALEQWGVAL
jgi:uncharacterized protein (TIGR04255 family)